MALFDFIQSFFMPVDIKKVVSASEKAVRERSMDQLLGLAEEMAKDKLTDIAAEIVGEKVDELLGDKANNIPKTVKNKIIEKACAKVVDKIWDDVKAKIAEAAAGAEKETAASN